MTAPRFLALLLLFILSVQCQATELVMCERTEKLTTGNIQDLSNCMAAQGQMYKEARQLLDDLKQNFIPVGFIYVQLAGQKPPNLLWLQTTWKDVTSSYAGLFFRAEGGNAAPFGQIQEENTKRLLQVDQKNDQRHVSPLTVPDDGTWSESIHTARSFQANDAGFWAFRFRLSTGEIRPRNQAIRIWQRV